MFVQQTHSSPIMFELNSIQSLFKNQESWRILFTSIGLLGIYLSFILLIPSKQKNRLRSLLGFYIVSLSFLLIHIISLIYPYKILNGALKSAGQGSLFLIGPFSYHMFHGHGHLFQSPKFLIQLLPAVVAMFFAQVFPQLASWIYMAGIVHIGFYMIFQSIFFSSIYGGWNKRYAGIQLVLFVVTSLTCITCPRLVCNYFTSISLSILILAIWIRLLHNAYSNYLKSNP